MKPSMNRMLLVLLALLVVYERPGFATDYLVDASHTRPVFRLSHQGFAAQFGRFNRVSGWVRLDVAARNGSVDLTIFTGSLEMTMGGAAEHLMGDGMLDVERFPEMRFTSDKLLFQGDKVIGAYGQFTLLGVTRPLVVSVNDFQCKDVTGVTRALCSGDITASLSRSDYGLTRFKELVDDKIDVRVRISVYRARSRPGGP